MDNVNTEWNVELFSILFKRKKMSTNVSIKNVDVHDIFFWKKNCKSKKFKIYLNK